MCWPMSMYVLTKSARDGGETPNEGKPQQDPKPESPEWFLYLGANRWLVRVWISFY